ncbi:MAG: hypothetical protein ACT4OI_09890, partial [Methanobacteriota archaeon]
PTTPHERTSSVAVGRLFCPHARLAALGRSGRTLYFRCGGCGRVFIEQDDRVWTLRRSAGA